MDANDIKLVKLLRRGWSATPLGTAHSAAASLDVYTWCTYIDFSRFQIHKCILVLLMNYIGKTTLARIYTHISKLSHSKTLQPFETREISVKMLSVKHFYS